LRSQFSLFVAESRPMTLVLVLEQRFARTPDGVVWAPGPFMTNVWPRYLEVFDHLRVLARVRDVPTVERDWEPASGESVSFTPVPYYVGPLEYALRYFAVASRVRSSVEPDEAVILRVPSTVGTQLARHLRRRGHPFGVEVVGDPYDVFAPGSVRHPLRPFFRWWSPKRLRTVCAGAVGALYVTERLLQARYPCRGYSVGVSDVELSDEAFSPTARTFDAHKKSFVVVTVGTLQQLYKAPDILIDAVGMCVRGGMDIRLVIAGDGQYRSMLERQAQRLGLAKRVIFRGHLASRAAIRAALDESDLFVLPSYQEGLPRAAVEAMARALPCVSSTVGGFPELLPPEDMVPAGNTVALASKINEVLADPLRLTRMSARNLERARAFHENRLQRQRVTFYTHIRAATETFCAASRTIRMSACGRASRDAALDETDDRASSREAVPRRSL
jgi:glycosyltransferase involved in cell wall biosynthesis